MRNKTLIIAVLFIAISSYAQENYKYVIIPKKFSFLDEEDKFNLNTLSKSFFESEGFTVFFDTEDLPYELAKNRCNLLFVEAIETNKFFTTNINFIIKDCGNKLLLEGSVGSSREKEYLKSYTIAVREALTSMRGKLKINNANSNNVKKIVEFKETFEVDPIVSEEKNAIEDILYALPIQNGYKIVDSTPTVIYIILSTSNKSVFIANKGELTGVFIEKTNGWYFEYYRNSIFISESVEVKF